jgi:hypothetical protein
MALLGLFGSVANDRYQDTTAPEQGKTSKTLDDFT